jgi:kumamolisin
VYHLVSTIVAGCNPNTVTENPSGGSKLIAIVDAYDDPDAMSDLNTFSSQFGLSSVTSTTFKVVFAAGTRPAQDPTGGWEGEESLDIEMAHAMAPGADIVLVEAASNSDVDLFTAVSVAGTLVASAGGGEVLMDWGDPRLVTRRHLTRSSPPPVSSIFRQLVTILGPNTRVSHPTSSPPAGLPCAAVHLQMTS